MDSGSLPLPGWEIRLGGDRQEFTTQAPSKAPGLPQSSLQQLKHLSRAVASLIPQSLGRAINPVSSSMLDCRSPLLAEALLADSTGKSTWAASGIGLFWAVASLRFLERV
jgi:hypothetical protein